MTKQEIIEALNEKFKEFFKEKGFKVRKEYSGVKATNQSTTLTFYLECDTFAQWYREQEQVDSILYAKLPYTDYELVHYYFKLDENDLQHNFDILDKIFTDPEFLEMLKWCLPSVSKKIK